MAKKLETLCTDIRDWLTLHELTEAVTVFIGGKRYEWKPVEQEWDWVPGHASTYDEYLSDDSLSMMFEGPLYGILNNYTPNDILVEEFNKLFDKKGYYYEFGHPWSLVAVKK